MDSTHEHMRDVTMELICHKLDSLSLVECQQLRHKMQMNISSGSYIAWCIIEFTTLYAANYGYHVVTSIKIDVNNAF